MIRSVKNSFYPCQKMIQKTVFSKFYILAIESRLLKCGVKVALSKNESHTVGNAVCSFRLLNDCTSIVDDQKYGSSLP